MTMTHDKPLATKGMTSYRCRSPFGWIMIGARDSDDAMRQARLSNEAASREDLQIWDGVRYRDAGLENAA